MTLAEFLKALEGLENGKELVAFFNSQMDTSKEEVGKRNRENQNLRARLKTAEDALTPAKERLEKIAAKLGLDPDDEDYESTLDAMLKGKKGDDNALTKRLERLEKQRKQEADENKARIEAERTKRHELLRKQELQKALAEHKAVGPDQIAQLLLASTKVRDDDDAVVFISETGDEIKVGDGVKSYLDKFPMFRMNDQLGGAGSQGGTGGGGKGADDPGVAMAKALAADANKADQAAGKAREQFFGGGQAGQ